MESVLGRKTDKQLFTVKRKRFMEAKQGLGAGRDPRNGQKRHKTDMRFGICNVRSLYRLGSLKKKTVTTELSKCRFDTEKAGKVRWVKVG